MTEDKEKLKDFALQFGKVVRKARLVANLTQEELGEKVNSNRGAIVRIENGKAVYMPASRALEICEALDTSLTEVWRDLNGNGTGDDDGKP